MKNEYKIEVFDKINKETTLKFKLIENKGVFRLYTKYNLLTTNKNKFNDLKQIIKNYALYQVQRNIYNDIRETDLLIITLEKID